MIFSDEVEQFIGTTGMTIHDAMKKIESNSRKILFLTEDGILKGCVTDGDIRRYLLSGGTMDDCVKKAANLNPVISYNEIEAKTLYRSYDRVAIPILDQNGNILKIYEEGGDRRVYSPIGLPVVINAGGMGTRLEPFTKVLPKPLIPVGELPIIELIMNEYKKYSCKDFSIIVNYKKELIKAYFNDSNFHHNITWYDEEKPLGTGGGVSLLRGKINSTFFFASCDALLTANYSSVLRFHQKNGNIITMICAYKELNIPYGIVEMGENGIIKSMKEKPQMSFLTNTGIYIVEPEVIDDIEDGEVIGFPDIVEREKQKGKKVAVFPVGENDWMDMGQLPELEKMRLKICGE